MSSTTKEPEKPKNSGLKTIIAFIKDERFRFAAGIVFILFTFYLFLAFISYFFHWETDQDFKWVAVFSGPEITVDNSAGKWGAWLADLFINRWFGIPSLLFPLLFLIWALPLYGIRLYKTWRVVRNLLILVIL
ncbi:DNA translocase FtsK 4TM domain-containing protein, partial [Bacteroidota bacterium]